MKAINATLGVARSNVIERRSGKRPRRGPQERPGDVELGGAIRTLVDATDLRVPADRRATFENVSDIGVCLGLSPGPLG